MRRWIDENKRCQASPDHCRHPAAVREPKGSSQQSQYEADYEALMSMHTLAAEAQISILVLHHQRKVVRTTDRYDVRYAGLTGGVDDF